MIKSDTVISKATDDRYVNFARLPSDSISNKLRMARYKKKKAISEGRMVNFPVEIIKP